MEEGMREIEIAKERGRGTEGKGKGVGEVG